MLNRRRLLSSSLALGVTLSLVGCGYRYEEFRYRLTVEVETPQGLCTGFSIIELRIKDSGHSRFAPPESRGARVDLSGEAVAVDLPNGQILFALLSEPGFPDGAERFPRKALRPANYYGEYAPVRQFQEMKEKNGVGILPADAYPMLVTFRDLSDPSSVSEVKPDDLAASFGKGVKLKRITVQITDEPVSAGLERRLAWIGGFPEERLVPPTGGWDFSLPAQLTKRQFRRAE